MDFVARSLSWQRTILAAMLFTSAVAFTRATYDVFNTTKATGLAVGAVALAVVGAVRVLKTRHLSVPLTPAVPAVGLFVVGLVAATLVSATPWIAVVGRPGRHTGLAMYALYAVLLLLCVRLYREHSPDHLAKAVMLAAVPTIVYGMMQAVGWEPMGWTVIEGGPQVFAMFGNANFYAAYLGIVVPLAVWGALTTTWSEGWRAASAIVAVLAFVAAFASNSIQGPAAALAGTGLLLLVTLFASDRPRLVRWRLPAVGVLLAAGLLLVGLVAAGVGPLAAVKGNVAASYASRAPKWEIALQMFADRPVLGYGLEAYGDWYHRYRTPELAAASGMDRTVDSPHNVVLDMLANGGVVLAAGYLAIVGVALWALVLGWRRLRGEDLLLLGGLGGAWLAYQLQSMVSIDVPPLAVLHYVLAGAIVAIATRPALRTVRLPGAPAAAADATGQGSKGAGGKGLDRKGKASSGKGKAKGKRGARLRPVPVWARAALPLAALAALWVVTMPWRADAAAGRAVRQGHAGMVDSALASYAKASRVGSWEARYPALAGAYLQEQGRHEEALVQHQEASRREPRGLSHVLNIGRIAAALGDLETADEAYDRALDIDPHTPEVLVEVGRFRLAAGDVERAGELLERAVAVRGDNAEWWVAVGEARSAEGDTSGARDAYQRALDLNPEAPGAAEALAGLAE